MATITEDYVSFETAKLLKEKGFDKPCFAYYSEYFDNWKSFRLWRKFPTRSVPNKGYMNVPTLQMAMKWLREVHGIFITIEIKGDPRKEDFIYYKWSVAKFNGNQITRIDNGLHTPEDYWVAECEEGEDYNKSCETAIKYCLENLI